MFVIFLGDSERFDLGRGKEPLFSIAIRGSKFMFYYFLENLAV